jgi:hypothetical protein
MASIITDDLTKALVDKEISEFSEYSGVSDAYAIGEGVSLRLL